MVDLWFKITLCCKYVFSLSRDQVSIKWLITSEQEFFEA